VRLDEQDHRALALWAADCARSVGTRGRLASSFENRDEPRFSGWIGGRATVEAGRGWVRGEIAVGEARAVAFAAHAAARDAEDPAGHARHAAAYAVKAATYTVVPTDAAAAATTERDWQVRRLPEHLRSVALPALENGGTLPW